MTISKPVEAVDIFTNTQRRKRWAVIEKHRIVQETYQAGATVSYVARKHGIAPSQLLYWRKVMESGALSGIKTEEELVSVNEVNDLKRRIKQLERVLGQKTMDIEILRKAVKIGREKNSSRENHCPAWKIWIKSHCAGTASRALKYDGEDDEN